MEKVLRGRPSFGIGRHRTSPFEIMTVVFYEINFFLVLTRIMRFRLFLLSSLFHRPFICLTETCSVNSKSYSKCVSGGRLTLNVPDSLFRRCPLFE